MSLVAHMALFIGCAGLFVTVALLACVGPARHGTAPAAPACCQRSGRYR